MKTKYSPQWYTPRNLEKQDPKEVRAEYTRLRDMVRKRLKAFENQTKKGLFEWTRTSAYQTYRAGVPKLKDISAERLPYELSKLARWSEQESSKVSVLKKRAKQSIKTLHEHGYTFVTPENYLDFGEFMEQYRQQKLDRNYGSPEAAELYEALQEKKVDPSKIYADFEEFLLNKNVISEMKPLRTASGKKSKSAKSYKMSLSKSGKWKHANRNSG